MEWFIGVIVNLLFISLLTSLFGSQRNVHKHQNYQESQINAGIGSTDQSIVRNNIDNYIFALPKPTNIRDRISIQNKISDLTYYSECDSIFAHGIVKSHAISLGNFFHNGIKYLYGSVTPRIDSAIRFRIEKTRMLQMPSLENREFDFMKNLQIFLPQYQESNKIENVFVVSCRSKDDLAIMTKKIHEVSMFLSDLYMDTSEFIIQEDRIWFIIKLTGARFPRKINSLNIIDTCINFLNIIASSPEKLENAAKNNNRDAGNRFVPQSASQKLIYRQLDPNTKPTVEMSDVFKQWSNFPFYFHIRDYFIFREAKKKSNKLASCDLPKNREYFVHTFMSYITSFWLIGNDSCEEILIDFLGDRRESIMIHSVKALSTCGTRAAIPRLEKLREQADTSQMQYAIDGTIRSIQLSHPS
jgi:hypothetical protein